MHTLLKKLADGAADAGAYARSLAEAGLGSVSQVLRGTRIFGALTTSAVEHLERDETHYLCVPLPGPGREAAIYTKRILPPGVGATNALPKARIFHLPDETGRELMEQKLVADLVRGRLDPEAGRSDMADTLERVADRLDKETNRISGGLVLIGGAVALMNPLLGVGIAAKALLPSLGSKASKAGVEYVGKKMREWNASSAEERLRKGATREVGALKPTLYANPVLRCLEAVVTNPRPEFDPFLDRSTWVEAFPHFHYYQVTREAIREVYRDVLPTLDAKQYPESRLHWIRTCMEELPLPQHGESARPSLPPP
jgi:hypothetical protein